MKRCSDSTNSAQRHLSSLHRMEEGEGLEALRQQLEEKEKEFEEIKAKAAEETQKQIESVMKLVEDKGSPPDSCS